MRRGASVAAVAILFAAAPCHALDPARADIIGLRLGMPETEIAAALRRQGFAVGHDHGSLSARTRDGLVTVELGEDNTARRIRYKFSGTGVEEPEKIRNAVIERFGPPDQAKPMAWCQGNGREGVCPNNAPSLTFLPESLTLLLRTDAERP